MDGVHALKYGALSSDEGTLDVSASSHEDQVVVVWTERGGPPVESPTGQGGFGSQLIIRAMPAQLGGTLSCDWAEGGVIVTLRMDRKSLKA